MFNGNMSNAGQTESKGSDKERHPLNVAPLKTQRCQQIIEKCQRNLKRWKPKNIKTNFNTTHRIQFQALWQNSEGLEPEQRDFIAYMLAFTQDNNLEYLQAIGRDYQNTLEQLDLDHIIPEDLLPLTIDTIKALLKDHEFWTDGETGSPSIYLIKWQEHMCQDATNACEEDCTIFAKLIEGNWHVFTSEHYADRPDIKAEAKARILTLLKLPTFASLTPHVLRTVQSLCERQPGLFSLFNKVYVTQESKLSQTTFLTCKGQLEFRASGKSQSAPTDVRKAAYSYESLERIYDAIEPFLSTSTWQEAFLNFVFEKPHYIVDLWLKLSSLQTAPEKLINALCQETPTHPGGVIAELISRILKLAARKPETVYSHVILNHVHNLKYISSLNNIFSDKLNKTLNNLFSRIQAPVQHCALCLSLIKKVDLTQDKPPLLQLANIGQNTEIKHQFPIRILQAKKGIFQQILNNFIFSGSFNQIRNALKHIDKKRLDSWMKNKGFTTTLVKWLVRAHVFSADHNILDWNINHETGLPQIIYSLLDDFSEIGVYLHLTKEELLTTIKAALDDNDDGLHLYYHTRSTPSPIDHRNPYNSNSLSKLTASELKAINENERNTWERRKQSYPKNRVELREWILNGLYHSLFTLACTTLEPPHIKSMNQMLTILEDSQYNISILNRDCQAQRNLYFALNDLPLFSRLMQSKIEQSRRGNASIREYQDNNLQWFFPFIAELHCHYLGLGNHHPKDLPEEISKYQESWVRTIKRLSKTTKAHLLYCYNLAKNFAMQTKRATKREIINYVIQHPHLKVRYYQLFFLYGFSSFLWSSEDQMHTTLNNWHNLFEAYGEERIEALVNNDAELQALICDDRNSTPFHEIWSNMLFDPEQSNAHFIKAISVNYQPTPSAPSAPTTKSMATAPPAPSIKIHCGAGATSQDTPPETNAAGGHNPGSGAGGASSGAATMSKPTQATYDTRDHWMRIFGADPTSPSSESTPTAPNKTLG